MFPPPHSASLVFDLQLDPGPVLSPHLSAPSLHSPSQFLIPPRREDSFPSPPDMVVRPVLPPLPPVVGARTAPHLTHGLPPGPPPTSPLCVHPLCRVRLARIPPLVAHTQSCALAVCHRLLRKRFLSVLLSISSMCFHSSAPLVSPWS